MYIVWEFSSLSHRSLKTADQILQEGYESKSKCSVLSRYIKHESCTHSTQFEYMCVRLWAQRRSSVLYRTIMLHLSSIN